MRVESIRLGPHIARHAPGAPYYATATTLRGSMTVHRNHDYAEFTAIAAGEGRLTTFPDKAEPYAEPLLPGRIYLFRPVDVQQLAGTGREGMTIFNIAFPLAAWQGYLRLAEADPGLMTSPRPPLARFDPDDPTALAAHRRAIQRFWEGATMLDLVEFWTAMLPRFVLPRFGANGRADSGRDSPPWLRSALDAMRSEDNLRGGVPRLLELAHVSPAHLWRTARRIHGVTPSELVRQLQIRHAGMLLGTTDDSIGSVGARAGFASASHFSKAFRRAHSMSPREYRTRVRHSLDGPPRAAESGEDRLPVPPD